MTLWELEALWNAVKSWIDTAAGWEIFCDHGAGSTAASQLPSDLVKNILGIV